MELLNAIRWNEAFLTLVDDTGIRVLMGMFLLLLTTCSLCCWLYDAAPATEQATCESEVSAKGA